LIEDYYFRDRTVGIDEMTKSISKHLKIKVNHKKVRRYRKSLYLKTLRPSRVKLYEKHNYENSYSNLLLKDGKRNFKTTSSNKI